jgi:amino acid permease
MGFSNDKMGDDIEYGSQLKAEETNAQGQTDAVFGEVVEGGPNYRSVSWWGSSIIMMKTQIGLGVLSIPAAFDALGLIPGILSLLAIGGITLWSGYMVGTFKMRHPETYGIEDVGQKLFGRAGREVLGLAFALLWTCVAGSGMLGISIGLNSLSEHGTCTAIFVAVACFVGFCLASIKTLGKLSWIAWVGLAGIMSAIITLTVSVGIQDRPSAAPQFGPWQSDFELFKSPTFAEAAAALSSIVFAFCGIPAYFNVVSEMKDHKDYFKALSLCQFVMTSIYIAIGVVVYYYCGSYVASPALGSAGVLMKKICYGLALPGLLASVILVTHVSYTISLLFCSLRTMY